MIVLMKLPIKYLKYISKKKKLKRKREKFKNKLLYF